MKTMEAKKKKKKTSAMARLHILAHKAWLREAFAREWKIADRAAEDKWYRAELTLVAGQATSTGLTKEKFEEVMLHFAVLADDDREIGYWSGAAERRHVWQIHRFLRLLSDVEGETLGWSYVRSICDRMSLPEQLADMGAAEMQHVIAALDTHFRRLCKRLAIDNFAELRRQLESADPRQRQLTLAYLADRRAARKQKSEIQNPKPAMERGAA